MSILVFAPGPSQHPPPQLVPSSPRSALMGPSRGPGSYTCSWSSACTAPGPWFSSGDPEVSQEIEWNELSCSCSDWQTVFAVSTVCLERSRPPPQHPLLGPLVLMGAISGQVAVILGFLRGWGYVPGAPGAAYFRGQRGPSFGASFVLRNEAGDVESRGVLRCLPNR